MRWTAARRRALVKRLLCHQARDDLSLGAATVRDGDAAEPAAAAAAVGGRL